MENNVILYIYIYIYITLYLSPFFSLQSNMILFINIIISLNSIFKNLNAEVSQMKQTKWKTLWFNHSIKRTYRQRIHINSFFLCFSAGLWCLKHWLSLWFLVAPGFWVSSLMAVRFWRSSSWSWTRSREPSSSWSTVSSIMRLEMFSPYFIINHFSCTTDSIWKKSKASVFTSQNANILFKNTFVTCLI